jgi:PTS hybrid protein
VPVGIVVVSHSRRLAEGVCEIAEQMAAGMVTIRPAGGTEDGALGTSANTIAKAIQTADSGEGVLVLMDLGSAVLSAETALEFLPDEQRARVALSDAPVVEGAVVAAVEASIGRKLHEVADAALKVREMAKVSR